MKIANFTPYLGIDFRSFTLFRHQGVKTFAQVVHNLFKILINQSFRLFKSV